MGLDKKQIAYLKKQNSRWATIFKNYPQVYTVEREMGLLNVLNDDEQEALQRQRPRRRKRKIRPYRIDSLMMYQWVDCLNIDTPRGVRRLPSRDKVVLYDSDEELFFERLNRRSFDHVCRVERLINYSNRYAAWVVHQYPNLPPFPDYRPIMRGRRFEGSVGVI